MIYFLCACLILSSVLNVLAGMAMLGLGGIIKRLNYDISVLEKSAEDDAESDALEKARKQNHWDDHLDYR